MSVAARKFNKDLVQSMPNLIEIPNPTTSYPTNTLVTFKNITQESYNVQLETTNAPLTHTPGETKTYIRISGSGAFDITSSTFNTTWKVCNSSRTVDSQNITFNSGIGYRIVNNMSIAPWGDNRSVNTMFLQESIVLVFGSNFGGNNGFTIVSGTEVLGTHRWDISYNSGVIPRAYLTYTFPLSFRGKSIIVALTGTGGVPGINHSFRLYNGTYNLTPTGVTVTHSQISGGNSATNTFVNSTVAYSIPLDGIVTFEFIGNTTPSNSSFLGVRQLAFCLLEDNILPTNVIGAIQISSQNYGLGVDKIYKNITTGVNAGADSPNRNQPLAQGTFFSTSNPFLQLANDNGYGASDTPSSTPGTFKYNGVENGWQCVRAINADGSLRTDFLPRLNLNVFNNYNYYVFTYLKSSAITINTYQIIGDGIVIQNRELGFITNAGGAQSPSFNNIIFKGRFIANGLSSDFAGRNTIIRNCEFYLDFQTTGGYTQFTSVLSNSIIKGNWIHDLLEDNDLSPTLTLGRRTYGTFTQNIIVVNKIIIGLGQMLNNYILASERFKLYISSSTDSSPRGYRHNNIIQLSPNVTINQTSGHTLVTNSPNFNQNSLFNNVTINDFTLNKNSFHFRNGEFNNNIAFAQLGFPMYATSNGNELVTWNRPLTLGISTDSPSLNIPSDFPIGVLINQIHYVGREDLNPNVSSINLTTGICSYEVGHNSPTDVENITGRVGVFVKFIFNEGYTIDTVYSNPAFNGYLFVETHSDIYLEVVGNSIIGTQWLRSNGTTGELPTNGVSTQNLIPLRGLGHVLSIQYKLYYPNYAVTTPHAFKGITAVAWQNYISKLDIYDRFRKISGTSTGTYPNTNTLLLPGNLQALNISSPGENGNLILSASQNNINFFQNLNSINRRYGWSKRYTLSGNFLAGYNIRSVPSTDPNVKSNQFINFGNLTLDI